MGQKQLILVVLVTVLVGIATIAAINTFGQSTEISNRESVRQDLLYGANMAQTVYYRSILLGGAGRDFANYNGNILDLMGLPMTQNASGEWENENGTYNIEELSKDSFTIRGRPATGGPDILALVELDEQNRIWMVSINDDEE